MNGDLHGTLTIPGEDTVTEEIKVKFAGGTQGAFQVWAVPTFGDDDRETVLVSDGQVAIVDMNVG